MSAKIIREYEDKNIKMILIKTKTGYTKHVKSYITFPQDVN
jgi:hypothetical protein